MQLHNDCVEMQGGGEGGDIQLHADLKGDNAHVLQIHHVESQIREFSKEEETF